MANGNSEWTELVPHPVNDGAGYGVAVRLAIAADGRWLLDYRITGAIAGIVLPRGRAAERGDGLWQQTCFELFAMAEDGSYHEWNFAPDGCWALYAFGGYRAPIVPPPATMPPVVATRADRDIVTQVAVDVWPMTGTQSLRIGLSAVIECANGTRDYWALAHGEGRPDFHAPTCFALNVSAPLPS